MDIRWWSVMGAGPLSADDDDMISFMIRVSWPDNSVLLLILSELKSPRLQITNINHLNENFC